MILQAARNWYLENKGAPNPLKISVFDQQAGSKLEILATQYPWLQAITDISPFDLDASSASFRRLDWLQVGAPDHPFSNVYLALEDDQRSFSVALSMAQKARDSQISVVISMENEGGLGRLLSTVDEKGNILEKICPVWHP